MNVVTVPDQAVHTTFISRLVLKVFRQTAAQLLVVVSGLNTHLILSVYEPIV